MHSTAWDRSLNEANRPVYYSKNPLSPFAWPQQPMPLYVLKYKGLVPSSCVPDNPDIPLLKHSRDSLVLKLTSTGVVFLGHYDEETKKYEQTGGFKRRYTGSKTCAVCSNGRLWLDAKELESESKKPKEVGKKKRAGQHPGSQTLLIAGSSDCEPGAISEENTERENFASKVAKKERKKAYRVDKQKVRQRILGYINTKKGKKELYFWTVSFPAGTPDEICYKAFNTWLTALRQRRMLREYLWIAERQLGERSAPGKAPTLTIHFHIAIPHFMNVHRANGMMRGTLKTYAKRGEMPGVVCHAKSKQTYYLPCIAKYNGVDICKNRKTNRIVNFAVKKGSRALATYLTKYVTKNNAGVPDETGEITVPAFTHLAWHNSRGFSCLFTAVILSIDEFKKAGFGPFLNKIRTFRMNFATFIPWLFGPPPLLLDHLFNLNSYIQKLLDHV